MSRVADSEQRQATRHATRQAAAVPRSKGQPVSVGHSSSGGAGRADGGVPGHAWQTAAAHIVSGPWASSAAVAQHNQQQHVLSAGEDTYHNNNRLGTITH
jgi:hypothetical protein